MNEKLKIQYRESEEIAELRKIEPSSADRHRMWVENQEEKEVKIGIDSLKCMLESNTPQQVFDMFKNCYEAMIEHNKNILPPDQFRKKYFDHILAESKNEKNN